MDWEATASRRRHRPARS